MHFERYRIDSDTNRLSQRAIEFVSKGMQTRTFWKKQRDKHQKFSVKMTTSNLKLEHNCLVHLDLSLGSTSFDYRIHKRRFPQLSILPNCEISHSEVKLITGQDNFSLIRLIEYKHKKKTHGE